MCEKNATVYININIYPEEYGIVLSGREIM